VSTRRLVAAEACPSSFEAGGARKTAPLGTCRAVDAVFTEKCRNWSSSANSFPRWRLLGRS